MNPKQFDKDIKARARCIERIKNTGVVARGYEAAGMTEAGFYSYCADNPSFKDEVDQAVKWHKLNKMLTSADLRGEALQLLLERIRDKTITDRVLYAVVFGRNKGAF